MTIRVLPSPAQDRNPAVFEVLRLSDAEDNAAWLRRVLDARMVETGASWSTLLLVGGNDPLSFRLRVAQSHARHDLSPSAWSHVVFLPGGPSSQANAKTMEVSLAPERCFGEHGFPLPSNGLQEGRLGVYLDRERFPNIALLSVPVRAAEIAETLRSFRFRRSVLDVPPLILRWLAYSWGVGVPASPLTEGIGIPGAAILEAAFAARGFDLTPGLESRSSCPEAIWQAATWWYDYYQRAPGGRAMKGAYCAKHDLVPDESYGGSPPPVTPPRATARRRRTGRGRK
jgi:hypothetical protein